MTERAVTPDSILTARIGHRRLPVPSADDIKAMEKMMSEKFVKRVKQPAGKSVSRKECERAVTEAAKLGIDKTVHIMFAAMLFSNMSVRTAREMARNFEKAADMFHDGILNDWDIEKQILDEWGIEFQKNRTWGLKK